MLINNGEINDLFDPEEKIEILSNTLFRGQEKPYELFLKNSNENLHLILSFSYIGQSLKNLVKTYPSIINSVTISWI